jgi:hypothetical protein
MAKLPHQSSVEPAEDQDTATKAYADASGGGSALEIEDETVSLSTAVTKINFEGAGVTATEPVADEILVTIPGGSSGPLASAQGAYMVKNMGSSQAGVGTAAEILNFDTIVSSRGDLGGAGNQVTGLKAGRTYLLIGRSRGINGNYYTLRFYDATAAAFLGDDKSGVGGDVWITPNVTHIFTPTVDTDIELWAQSTNSSMTFDGLLSEFQVIEIGAVQANVIGGLEFMDIIDVTIATNEVSFGAAGDGAFLRALDGDLDEEYFCSYYMPGDHAGSTMHWVVRPNGATTSQQSAADYSGATSGKITTSTFMLGDQFVARDCRGTFTLFAKTGRARYFVSDNVVTAPGGGAGEMHQSRNAGTWDEQVTNIESLVFAHTDGAGDYILPGAQLILWRRTSSNVRADSASIYERNVEAVVAQGTAAAQTYTTGAAVFGGSAVGVSVSLVDDTVVSGTVVVDFKVDGAVVLTATLDSVNTSMHRASSSVGAIPIIAGNEIEIDVTTTSLVTAGAPASPAISVNLMMTTDAFVQPPVGSAYLIASLAVQQDTNIAIGDHIEFDKQSSRGTAIAMSTGAGQLDGLFTLQPGKTYEIHASLQATTNEGACRSRWLLHPSNAVLVDDTGDPATLHNHADDIGDLNIQFSSVHVFTPSVETTIKIALQSPVVNFTRWEEYSRVLIKELL